MAQLVQFLKLLSSVKTRWSFTLILGMLLMVSAHAQSLKDFNALTEYFKLADERICNGQIIPGVKVQTLMGEAYQLEQNAAAPKAHFDRTTKSMYVESFYLPAGETFVLDNDLYLYSKGDVRIDGDILGKAITQSNAHGQDLIICAQGAIVINGEIRLSNGGDGKNSLASPFAMRSNYTNSLALSTLNNNPFLKWVNMATLSQRGELPGGNGGSILLKANHIVVNGLLVPGNGGTGFASGHGGDGGTLVCIGESMQNNKPFVAGNGGDGGDGITLSHPEGGQGGEGGEALLLACPGTPGTTGSIGTSMVNATAGGNGGIGDNGTNGTACAGGAGGAGGAGRDGADFPSTGTSGANGGNGGRGGNATNTVAGGDATGGNGGNGGNGGKGGNGGTASGDDGANGGRGGNGGNGGTGTGANGATDGTCTAAEGGDGTGGDGGDGGAGGNGGNEGTSSSGVTERGNGGDGGNGGDSGSGIGGNGGICTSSAPCPTVPGGIGTRGGAGAGGAPGIAGIGSGDDDDDDDDDGDGDEGDDGDDGSSVETNGSAGSCSILPVELTHFAVALIKQEVVLNWQTANELNNEKFIIEASIEGEVFNHIGEVQGAGTTFETQNYQFTHHTPSAGINYYRLKQVDFDGTFAYSKVVAINAPGSNDIFAFPNPARDKITVQYDYSKGAANIRLFDVLGRKLSANIGGYAGNYEVQFPLGLPKGTYWLKVERGGKVQTLPVVKE